MAIQFRIARETANAGGTPRTVSTTGVVSGDLVLLAICFDSPISSYTPPSGFTLVASSSVFDTPSIYLYAKIAGGSEPSTYSVSWTGGGGGELGLLAIYSDLGLALFVDVAAAQHNASGNRLWPSLTTTVTGAFLACFAALTTNTATTPDAAMTERLDLANGLRVYLMTQLLGAAGATGTRTGTGTASVSSAVSVAVAEPGVHGAAAISLDAIALAAAGTVAVKGAAAIQLGALTLAATGVVPVQAGADILLAPMTLVAAGQVKVQGAAAITLSPVTLAGAGLGPPWVPTDFSAVAVTGSRIDLSWADDGPSISGFNIERSPTGIGSWVQIATVGAAVRSYADEGLPENSERFYRIRSRRD